MDAARLGTASAVAVMTGNDMVNIETAIAVHDSFGSPFQPERIPVVTGSSTAPSAGPRPGGSASNTCNRPRS